MRRPTQRIYGGADYPHPPRCCAAASASDMGWMQYLNKWSHYIPDFWLISRLFDPMLMRAYHNRGRRSFVDCRFNSPFAKPVDNNDTVTSYGLRPMTICFTSSQLLQKRFRNEVGIILLSFQHVLRPSMSRSSVYMHHLKKQRGRTTPGFTRQTPVQLCHVAIFQSGFPQWSTPQVQVKHISAASFTSVCSHWEYKRWNSMLHSLHSWLKRVKINLLHSAADTTSGFLLIV